ncbi:MAG: Crp/Fnr family transcriptional regulator [Bacteroidetes bacterium]|nr:Crp/Fnr family transcriptional regulator [Bacteroidota bacterium]MCH8325074.1 Crp/Fnr family transcriptional regulator [Bacteroidota bacterium]
MTYRNDLPVCKDCENRFGSIFKNISEVDILKLSEFKCVKIYKKGQNIFLENSQSEGIYCINKGKVKLYKYDKYGNVQILRLAKEGDLIGYRSLIVGEHYNATATAMEDSVICYISKNIFFALLRSNPELSVNLMKLLSDKLKTAENHMVSISLKNVRERVAETILLIKDFWGEGEDGTLLCDLKREEMAQFTGTATETFIRFLSEFKNDKVIDLIGKKIKILNYEALEKIRSDD